MPYIIAGLVIALIIIFLAYLKEKQIVGNITEDAVDSKQELKDYPYKKKLLLTKNEWVFYKKLKPVCDKYDLHILSKIRFADLVEVKDSVDKKERIKYFNRISRKHIDFVLCKPENLQVVALIELDDKSHDNTNRAERDSFVDKVCAVSGYKMVHIRNYEEIEEKLAAAEIITKSEEEIINTTMQ